MMNQYYGFTARGGRGGHDRAQERGFDRSPYRRPAGRSGMPDRGMYPYGIPGSPHQGGGCGCGMMQNSPRPFGRGNGEDSRHQNQAIPAMNQAGHGNHDHHNGHDHDSGYGHLGQDGGHRAQDGGHGGHRDQDGGNRCQDSGNRYQNDGNRCQDSGNRYQNDSNRCQGGNNRCQNNGNTACDTLMNQIRAVDFALYETVLYLDVYPHSCDALETYHKLKAQSMALHEEYESVRGPLTAFGNRSTASWDWMSNPCPWEYDAD